MSGVSFRAFLKISRLSTVFKSFGKKFHTVGPLYRRDNLPTSMFGRITFSLLFLVFLAVSFSKKVCQAGISSFIIAIMHECSNSLLIDITQFHPPCR